MQIRYTTFMNRIEWIPFILAGALALGCNTQFNTKDTSTDQPVDGHDAVDAPVDAPEDSVDAPPDSADAPGDTEVEPEPPPEASCSVVRDIRNPLGSDVTISYGPDTYSGDFFRTNVWITKQGSRLVVVHGSEGVIFGMNTRLAGHVVDMSSLEDISTTMLSPPDNARHDLIRGTTLVRNMPTGNILLLPSHDTSGTGSPVTTLQRVRLNVVGDSILYDYVDLFQPAVPSTEGAVSRPRAVVTPDGTKAHVIYQLVAWDGGDLGQLHGATITTAQLNSGGLDRVTTFLPLEPARTRMLFANRPDCTNEILAIPYMHIDTSVSRVRSGVFVEHGSIVHWEDGPMHELEIEGTRRHMASLAGVWLDPERFATAGVSTASTFSSGGPLPPPYFLNTAVAMGDAIDGPPMGAMEVGGEIDMFGSRELDNYDFTDNSLLDDPTLPFVYYVGLYFPESGDAVVAVFPLREDGTEAGAPLFFDTRQHFMPALDVMIDPDTGHIYIVRHQETSSDVLANIPAFFITEIQCELVE